MFSNFMLSTTRQLIVRPVCPTICIARRGLFVHNGFKQTSVRLLQLVTTGGTRNAQPPVMMGLFKTFVRGTQNIANTQLTGHIPPHARKIVGRWLLGCAGMCFGAVTLGGITRLTESGLSITQWNLLKGMKPPRTDAEWHEEFERYKQFPEYKHLERDLSLEDFKRIFYWEYVHRMWGRCIGVVFTVPALFFLSKGWISPALKPRLAVYFTLLAFQGALGWYMVKSGLEEKQDPYAMPRVSQYRLAAHLGSALILYSLFLWQGLSHILTPNQLANVIEVTRLRKYAHGAKALVFLTAISGAFVAGLDAGLVYNSYPKMADRWIPDDLLTLSPKWKNIFENATTTQFTHRHLAEFTSVAVLGLCWLCHRAPIPHRTRMVSNALGAMVLIQVCLGVGTLLMYVPVWLAAAHQAGAISLLSLTIWLTHELRRLPK